MPKVENFKTFLDITDDKKKVLLLALGYAVDTRGFIIDAKTRRRVWCRYTEEQIHFNNASILPGSTVVINTTPTSMSKYIDEFLE